MLWRSLFLVVGLIASGATFADGGMSAKQAAIFEYYFQNDFDSFLKGARSVSGGILDIERVTAKKISDDYRQNEVLGDQQYYRKRLLVAGNVKAIKSGMGNSPFLVLDGPEFSAVQAEFDGGSAPRVAKLRKGAKVMIVCQGGGIVLGAPMLAGCRFGDELESDIKEKMLGAIRHPENDEFDGLGLRMGALLSVSEARLGEKTKCGIDQKACDKELSVLNKSKSFDQEVKAKAEAMKASR